MVQIVASAGCLRKRGDPPGDVSAPPQPVPPHCHIYSCRQDGGDTVEVFLPEDLKKRFYSELKPNQMCGAFRWCPTCNDYVNNVELIGFSLVFEQNVHVVSPSLTR